jgi:hypothetical protein
MKKAVYFDAEKFIGDVITAMGLGEVRAPLMLELREEIGLHLSQRIVGTIIDSFSRRDLDLFEKLLEDHPELDEVDALMVLAPGIEGLKEKMERNINSLFAEMVRNAETAKKYSRRELLAA